MTHAEANQAVQVIGTNAIPLLLELLQAKDSYVKKLVMTIAAKQHLVEFRFTRAENLWSRGLAGFRALGPAGKAALPSLNQVITRDNFQYALSAVAGFGEDAVPSLQQALTNQFSEIRSYAAYELGWVWPDAHVAAGLCKCLKDEAPEVRTSAGRSLGEIKKAPDISIPALIGLLEVETNSEAKAAALFALGAFGVQASQAVSVVRRIVSETNNMAVREAGSFALKQIDPAGAAE